MSQSNGPENERLERLLRQWGAEEASRREATAAPPAPVMRSSAVWRYAPMAAAMIILAVSVHLYINSSGTNLPKEDTLKQESLPQVQADLKAAREALAAAQAALAEQRRQADAEIAAVHSAADAERLQQQTAIDKLTADMAKAKTKFEAQLLTMATLAKAQDETLAKLKGQLEDQSTEQAALVGQYVTAKADVDRLTEQVKADNELVVSLKAELLKTETQCATLRNLLEQKNHAVTAGNLSLAQRQAESRGRDLIRRATALRRQTLDLDTRRLIDTVEFLLTQLDLLEPGNPAAVASYERQVQQADLAHRIDELVRSRQVDPAVRAWLTESEGVLSGSVHAS
jgi:hypothetical protein